MKKHYFLVFIVILFINFFLPRLMPGDPFLYLSVEDGNVSAAFSQEQIDYYKSYYGLDKPLHIQFFNYIVQLFKGNLGHSIYYNISVSDMILSRISWTIFIVAVSLILSSTVGIILGAVSAWKYNKAVDKILYSGMVFISEVPSFLLGILFLFVFAANLKLFPLSGGITVFASYNSVWEKLGDILYHAALPVFTLFITRVGDFYLLSRSSMLTVLSKDYIRTAKGKGLKKTKIIFRHALRNSLPPIIARIFMSLGNSFGAAVLIENVFAYPGVGRLMREAVLNRDYVLIQGIFLTVTIFVLVMNRIAELLYKKLDPRVV